MAASRGGGSPAGDEGKTGRRTGVLSNPLQRERATGVRGRIGEGGSRGEQRSPRADPAEQAKWLRRGEMKTGRCLDATCGRKRAHGCGRRDGANEDRRESCDSSSGLRWDVGGKLPKPPRTSSALFECPRSRRGAGVPLPNRSVSGERSEVRCTPG